MKIEGKNDQNNTIFAQSWKITNFNWYLKQKKTKTSADMSKCIWAYFIVAVSRRLSGGLTVDLPSESKVTIFN